MHMPSHPYLTLLNCGFINVRWTFNFVDIVVGPNHEIKCPRITKNQTFFPSKIQNLRIQMPSKQPFIVQPRNSVPSKFNETTVLRVFVFYGFVSLNNNLTMLESYEFHVEITLCVVPVFQCW